jgi:hypothetical protein
VPIRKEHYSRDWDKVSAAARERAGNRCERCGVPNHVVILRSVRDASRYVLFDEDTQEYRTPDGKVFRPGNLPAEFGAPRRHTYVVLTVHHKGVPLPDGTPGNHRNKRDNRPENLEALCQRCHLQVERDLRRRFPATPVDDLSWLTLRAAAEEVEEE